MTIDWLDLTCPCCGHVTLVSIRQLAHAPGGLACEACGGAFGRQKRSAAGGRPETPRAPAPHWPAETP